MAERLLADLKGQSGTLPLLQFALTEVWNKRNVRRLTLDAYKKLGKDDQSEATGIEGVLNHRANEIYRNLTPEDQDRCRRLFLRLVRPGEERTEDTKQRVSRQELPPLRSLNRPRPSGSLSRPSLPEMPAYLLPRGPTGTMAQPSWPMRRANPRLDPVPRLGRCRARRNADSPPTDRGLARVGQCKA